MEQLEEKEIIPYDVIVVGAGAAGMMAAGTAARNGKRVLLIEKMEKSGRKVRITGKGRCNVTNARPAEEFASQVRTTAEANGSFPGAARRGTSLRPCWNIASRTASKSYTIRASPGL